MKEKLWEDAMTGVDQKYIDIAVGSFRGGEEEAEVMDSKFIDPKYIDNSKKAKPKSKAMKFVTAAASLAAAFAMLIGGVLLVSYINNKVGVSSPGSGENAPAADSGSQDSFIISDEAAYSEKLVYADPSDAGMWYVYGSREADGEAERILTAYYDDGTGLSELAKVESAAGAEPFSGAFCFTGQGTMLLGKEKGGLAAAKFDYKASLTETYHVPVDDIDDMVYAQISQDGEYIIADYPEKVAVFDIKRGSLLYEAESLGVYSDDINVTVSRAMNRVLSYDGSKLLMCARISTSKSEPYILDLTTEEYTPVRSDDFDLSGADSTFLASGGDSMFFMNNNIIYRCDFDGRISGGHKIDPLNPEGGTVYVTVNVSPHGKYLLGIVNSSAYDKSELWEYRVADDGSLDFTRGMSAPRGASCAVNDVGNVLICVDGDVTVIRSDEEQQNALVIPENDEEAAFLAKAFTYYERDPSGRAEMRKNFVPDTKGQTGSGIGCDNSGRMYAIDTDDLYNLSVMTQTKDGNDLYYTTVTSVADDEYKYLLELHQNEPHAVRFFVTSDGPALLITRLGDETQEDVCSYILSYDCGLNMTNISKVEAPDSFFGAYTASLTYDGQYLIDAHWSSYMDSKPYIRVYKTGKSGQPTALAYEIDERMLGIVGEFVVKDVKTCAVSKDGKKLIAAVTADVPGFESLGSVYESAAYITFDLETGIPETEITQPNADGFTFLPYDGGVASIGRGMVSFYTENGAERYLFEDLKLNDDGYAVSPNGKYICALKIMNDGNELWFDLYDTANAVERNGKLWLSEADVVHSGQEQDVPVTSEILLAVSSKGSMFGLWDGGSFASGDLSGAFEQDGALFATKSDYAVTTAFDDEPSPESMEEWNADDEFMFPITDATARITAYFGGNGVSDSSHSGIDVTTDNGTDTPICAAADGVVEVVQNEFTKDDDNGGYIKIAHSEFETLYAHCGEIYVKEGETVRKGQIIASMGSTGLSTGVHLHFELLQYGEPVDPLEYIYFPTIADYVPPVTGGVLAEADEQNGGFKNHIGIDITPPDGAESAGIHAFLGGTVTFADFDSSGSGFGNYIVIEHPNGYETLYAHCDELYVNVGDTVSTGDVIAEMGSTGFTENTALHFELSYNGKPISPLDYLRF